MSVTKVRALPDGGAVWRIDYRDEHGRRVRVSVEGTRSAALIEEARLIEVRDERAAGVAEERQAPTVGGVVGYWLEVATRGMRPGLVERYRSACQRFVDPAFGMSHRLVEELGPQGLRDWLDAQRTLRGKSETPEPLSSRTKNELRNRLGAAIERWVKDKKCPIKDNPTTGVRYKERRELQIDVLTPDEERRVWAACLTHDERVAIGLGYWACLRKGEVAALRWHDWESHSRTLRVRRSHDAPTTKGGKERSLLLPEHLAAVLEEQRGRVGLSPFIVAGPDGKQLREASWNPERVLRKVLRRAGICAHWRHVHVGGGGNRKCRFPGLQARDASRRHCPECGRPLTPCGVPRKVRFHDLRHSGITARLESGSNVFEVAEVAGHASTETTRGYYHRSASRQRSSLDKLLAAHALASTALPGAGPNGPNQEGGAPTTGGDEAAGAPQVVSLATRRQAGGVR